MLVSTGGTKYKLSFGYVRDGDGKPLHTICYISEFFGDKLEEIIASPAYCHPGDVFTKEAGRKIALTRALETLFPYGSDTEESWDNVSNRRAFWDVYFDRKNNNLSPNGNK